MRGNNAPIGREQLCERGNEPQPGSRGIDPILVSLEAVLVQLDDLGHKEAAIHVCHSIDLLVAERDRERQLND